MNESTDKAASAAESNTRRANTGQGRAFSLQVKPEFVASKRPESLGPLPPQAEEPKSVDGSKRTSGKQRKKGRNKKRPRDARKDNSEKICLSVIRDTECPYGEEKCRYSHDLKGYMNTRPEDIKTLDDGLCPIVKNHGYCVFGAMCRFGLSHITKSGHNIIGEQAKTNAEGNPLQDVSLNILPKEVQNQLRKKKYPFSCKRYFEQDEGKRDNNTKPEESGKLETALKTDAGTYTPLELKTRKIIDFSQKVYVAPLTTVGNLPFRRIMKRYGADITCGEMAVATCLLEGKTSEWALVKRHPDEDIFGIQVAGAHPDQFTRVAEVIGKHTTCDFLDLNLGCPLDLLCQKGAGAALMMKEKKLKGALQGISRTVKCPITVKIRTGCKYKIYVKHKRRP